MHMPIAPILRNLVVEGMNEGWTSELVKDIAERAPQLTKLEMHNADYSNVLDLSALARLEHLTATMAVVGRVRLPATTTKLTVLPSLTCTLTELPSLAEMHPGNVRHLDLRGNKFLQSLKGVTDSMPALQTLDIRGCSALERLDIDAIKKVVPEVLV
jgi:Leucine-rich repeat (LRR) protein